MVERMAEEKHVGQKPVKASILLMQLREDIRALNSAISILSQKMRNLARNEKILGRNLIVLNKKVKELAELKGSQAMPSGLSAKLEELEKKIEDSNKRIEELNIVVSHLRKEFVSYDEFKELRQIVDAINPLELVTMEQVKELIERINKKQRDEF
jgi:chromosome segregation ATPase